MFVSKMKFFIHYQRKRGSLRFHAMLLYLANGSPHTREGILISSACMITLISNLNLMNGLKNVPIISQLPGKFPRFSRFPRTRLE